MRNVVLPLALLLAGCQQQPYRVFAVQVGSAPAPPSATAGAGVTMAVAERMGQRSAALNLGVDDVGALSAKHPQWDLNAASAQILGQLPGVDAATVQAIIAGRPYKSKRELVSCAILTQAQYDKWKSYLVVHRAGDAAGPPAAQP